MDLIVGHAKSPDGTFSTCVFSENYNAAIESKRKFASITGDEIRILAVFLGHGPKIQEVHASLRERIECKIVGWFNASPGELTDTVHCLLAPQSLANTFSRSMDNLIAPVESKSHVPASEPDTTTSNQPDGGKKTGVRVRKPR